MLMMQQAYSWIRHYYASKTFGTIFAALGGLSGIVSAAGHFLCDIDVPVDGVPEVLWPGLCVHISLRP